MSDTNVIPALILAAGMATAGGLVLDEYPQTQDNLNILESVSPVSSEQRSWPHADLGSSLNRRIYQMAAWLKGSDRHSKSMTT